MALSERLDASFRRRYPDKQVKAYADFYDDAVQLMKSKGLKSFELSEEPREVRDRYGNDRFSQGCLLARRLVERGVRFVEVTQSGWDTHQDNFDRMPTLGGTLDSTLATLLEDLRERSMLDSTLVVVATEFGRTPKINDRQGRDHHPRAFSCILAGAGVPGGAVYGSSDEKGFKVAEDGVEIPDFNATIAKIMGLPVEEVVTSPSGRPFTVAHKGKPIKALVS